jgi:hypothetical protein
MLKVGSLVVLANTALRDWAGIGSVVNVIAADADLPDLTLYDVDFASTLRTLHASELKPIRTSSSCDEKNRLLLAHEMAFDSYIRTASELAETVGIMTNEEFEFLYSRAQGARQFLVETRERLNDHTAEHRC